MNDSIINNTKTYNIITKKNTDFYDNLYNILKSKLPFFQKKEVENMMELVIDRKILIVGINNDTNYDNYGTVVIKGDNIKNIILNSSKLNINITDGKPLAVNNTLLFTYMLLIRGIVHTNHKKIVNDEKVIQACVNFFTLLFYKNLELRGLQEKQNSQIRALINIFFHKFIIHESTAKGLSVVKNNYKQEIYDFYKDKKSIIDSYKNITDIFRAFYDFELITDRNPNELLSKFISNVGIVGFSIMVKKGLTGFISAIIISKYDDKLFNGIFIDNKINDFFEKLILSLFKDQNF